MPTVLVHPNRNKIRRNTNRSELHRPTSQTSWYRFCCLRPVLPLVLLVVAYFLVSSLWLHSQVEDTAETAWWSKSLASNPNCYIYGCPTYSIQLNALEEATLLDCTSTRRIRSGAAGSFESMARGEDFSVGAVVTRQSNDHQFNQDRSVLLQPFWTEQTRHGASFLLAILDGHGTEGHYMAHYVAHALPKRLAEKLSHKPCCQSDEWVVQQLNDTLVEIDREAPPNALRGGTTASVTLRIGDTLFFANTGDSQTMLVHSTASRNASQHEIVFQTLPHKPHLPEELARIESLGGTIHIPPQFPAASRVVVYSNAAVPPELIGLAMSRSIGDWEWKPIGVIAEPTVNVVTLNRSSDGAFSQSYFFVMAASDGVWDMRPPQRFAELVGQPLLDGWHEQNHSLSSCFLFQLCASVIWKVSPAKSAWYRDDMTIALVPVL